jgi:pimeloyl-ACP methyl ester carboxylesterase
MNLQPGNRMEFTVNGHPVHAATGGRPFDPAKPAVVFLHGSAMDHVMWALPARHFARHGLGVLAVDLPGHGRSGGAPLPTVAALADWVVALLDTAGASAAALVGHSMGSLIALDAAARHPDRVTRIALLGSALPMAVAEPLLAAAAANDHAAIDGLMIWGHSLAGQLGGSGTPGIHVMAEATRLMERTAPGVLHADLNACNSYGEPLDRLDAIRCPTLLLLGERDLLTPRRATKSLAERIADVRSVVLPGCGHMMTAERPDAVLDALRGFLL